MLNEIIAEILKKLFRKIYTNIISKGKVNKNYYYIYYFKQRKFLGIVAQFKTLYILEQM